MRARVHRQAGGARHVEPQVELVRLRVVDEVDLIVVVLFLLILFLVIRFAVVDILGQRRPRRQPWSRSCRLLKGAAVLEADSEDVLRLRRVNDGGDNVRRRKRQDRGERAAAAVADNVHLIGRHVGAADAWLAVDERAFVGGNLGDGDADAGGDEAAAASATVR